MSFRDWPWKAIGTVAATAILSAVGGQQYQARSTPAPAPTSVAHKASKPEPCQCNCNITQEPCIVESKVWTDGKPAVEKK